VIAEVATQLAEHGRHRERREEHVVRGIETLDRLQQAELRDLNEVFEGLASPGEPSRTMRRDPPMVGDQRISQRGITRRAIRLEAGADITSVTRDRNWIPDRPSAKRPNQLGAAR
jgi:hypothetical protein